MNRVEIYGFVLWIGTFFVYAVLVLWAYLPESTLRQLGFTYYPAKDWAIAVPAYLFTAFALSGVCYVAINLLSTAPLDSFQTLTDSWARKPTIPPPGEEGPSVPNFGDLDIGVVNAVMFGSGGGSGSGARR